MQVLCSYWACTVLVPCWYCSRTQFFPCCYCTCTPLVPCSYWARKFLFSSCYSNPTLLVPRSYCSHTLLFPCSYCTRNLTFMLVLCSQSTLPCSYSTRTPLIQFWSFARGVFPPFSYCARTLFFPCPFVLSPCSILSLTVPQPISSCS